MNTERRVINQVQGITDIKSIIIALVALTIGLSSTFVFAQDALEEVVVTAQRREQNLQDVPISINAFDAAAVDKYMFNDMSDYITRTPNASWASTGSRSRRELAIRGTTNFLNVNSTLRSNTFAFYVDDFSIGGSSGNPPIMDIERIEILRGPQATYFGRNAMGGGISITSKKPNTEEVEGSIMFDYSNFDTKDVEGVFNIPIIKGVLAMRGNIKYLESEGNIKNINPNQDGNTQKNKYGRVAVRWTPTDDLTVDITASVGSEKSGMREGIASGELSFFGQRLFGNAPNNPPDDNDADTSREADPDGVGFWPNNTNLTNFGQDQIVGLTTRMIVGRVDYELNDKILLTSITGLIDSDFFLNGEIDGSSHSYFNEFRDIDRKSISQEVRIQNLDDGKFNWSIGAIYAKDEGFFNSSTFAGVDNPFGLPGGIGGTEVNQGFRFPGGPNSDEIESYAIFGQVDGDFLNDRLNLSFGGRYSEETRRFASDFAPATGPNILLGVTAKFTSFSPRFAANFSVNDDVNVYGSVSKGFKSGGVTRFDVNAVPYDPEVVWNYELGLKGTFFENRLRVSAAAFWMDWTGMQVEFLVPQLTATGVGGRVISNAEKATSKGLELSLTALPMDNLVLNFNVGYLKAKLNKATIFVRDNVCDQSTTECNHNFDGRTTPLSPKWTMAADAEWTHDLTPTHEGFARLEWTFRDTVDRTLVEGLMHPDTFPWKVPAYDFFNLRAGIRHDNYSVTAYAENLFDSKYYQNAYVKAWAMGVALEPSYRSYGVRFKYNYGQ